MFFKKIIQKNIKLLAVLVFVMGWLYSNYELVSAVTDVTLGSYQYKAYNNGEVYYTQGIASEYSDGSTAQTIDTTITENVGVYKFSGSDAIKNIVVSDSDGKKMKFSFDNNGFLNQIYDGKNGKEYDAKTGGANMGTNEMQKSLNDLVKISGYKGDLYKDVIRQKNIYYNNQLISKIQSAPANHIVACDANSRYGDEVKKDLDNGTLSTSDHDAIRKALRGEGPWTTDLAVKFRSAIYAHLGNEATDPQEVADPTDFFGNLYKLPGVIGKTINGGLDSYFFKDDAQKTIECAFIAATNQDQKDAAITTLKKLNEGGGIASISGDQLDSIANVGGGVTAGGGVGSGTEVADEVSGAVNQSVRDEANEPLEECFRLEGFIPGFRINPSACFAEFLYFILSILAFFLGVVGLFFNLVFDVTLVNMKENVTQIGIVSTGWATIRDFANILFIFMLLYLAISTILQLDDHGVKKGLSRLIVGAVLINFSLFFVKIPIDISNILAIEIYDTMTQNGAPDTAGEVSFGLGDTIMAMFSPQQVFKNSSLDPKTINEANAKVKPGEQIAWNLQTNPVTTFAMGIIVIFTALLIFLAVCIIFIKRFITLVMLMIFSPLAFAGMAIPNHDIEHQISSKFWSSLLKESFYAPVFMFMMYLTIKTGTSLNTLVASPSAQGWLLDTALVPVSNIISYSVVMGMMIFSLTVSETMGVKGASGAIKAFDAARGWSTNWAKTNTIGRMAWTRLNKGQSAADLQRDATGERGVVRQQLAKLQIATYGNIGKGFGEKVTRLKEAKEAYDHEMHGDTESRVDQLLYKPGQSKLRSNFQANDIMWDGMDVDGKASALVGMKKRLEKEKKRLEKDGKSDKEIKISTKDLESKYHYYEHRSKTPEERDKVDQKIRSGVPEHIEDVKDAILKTKDHTDHDGNFVKGDGGVALTALMAVMKEGQKRYAMNNLKFDDPDFEKAGFTKEEKQQYFSQVTRDLTPASAEALIKDAKTSEGVRGMISEGIMGSKLRLESATITADTKADKETRKIALKQYWAIKELKDIMEAKGMTMGGDIKTSDEATITTMLEKWKKDYESKDKTMGAFYDNQKRYIIDEEGHKSLKEIDNYNKEAEKKKVRKEKDDSRTEAKKDAIEAAKITADAISKGVEDAIKAATKK